MTGQRYRQTRRAQIWRLDLCWSPTGPTVLRHLAVVTLTPLLVYA
jgi:hypothetical protein